MKKLVIAMMALAVGSMAFAKSAEELRIYINPGHGSYTPDDRPARLVGSQPYSRTETDTTQFFESNTNLRKGFGVLEKLRTYGLKFDPSLNQEGERWQIGAARDMSNNIVMSHVKCGPYLEDNGTPKQLVADGKEVPDALDYYNRNLSEIDEEVDANHFDMFLSIHSNAAGEGAVANYPLLLYRGHDTPAVEEGEEGLITLEHQTVSNAMAEACWPYLFANPHSQWTYYSMTNSNVRGDMSFYGGSSVVNGCKGYLGVLKHHSPGFLAEGYFHTYQPARHRAMNWDVDYMEGAAYAHGIADYFGLTKETTGDIYGIVRDRYNKFRDDFYQPNPSTDDKYLPLNGVKVVLWQGETKVAEYVTDNFYNGAFVFKDVTPGTYTLTVEDEQYLPLDEPVEVVVKAADIAYPSIKVIDKDWTPPTKVYVDYPDVNNNAGIGAANEYNLNATIVDKEIAELQGKTIRRVLAFEDNVYVLAIDPEKNPTVLLLDSDLNVVRTLGVANVDKNVTVYPIADIQLTNDGVLVACSETKTTYDEATAHPAYGNEKFYKWANDADGKADGEAEVWFTTPASGNFLNANTGHTFVYQGSAEEGLVYFPSQTLGTSGTNKFFFNTIVIANGEGTPFVKKNAEDISYMHYNVLGHDYTFSLAPWNIEQFVVNSPKVAARAYAIPGNVVESLGELSTDLLPAASAGNAFFKHAGHAYMVAPSVDADGKSNGIAMFDVTNGLNEAKAVKVNGAEVEAAEGLALTAAVPVVAIDEESLLVTSLDFNVYMVRNGKISKFTTKGEDQPTNRSEYAYNLKAEGEDGLYTLSFDVTGDVENAIVTVTAANGEATVIPVGPVTKENGGKVEFDATELADGEYAWSVEVHSAPIAHAAKLGGSTVDYDGDPTNGSAIVFTDPEYDNYGMAFVSHSYSYGIELYDRDNQLVTHVLDDAFPPKQNSMIRGDQLRGKAVVVDWTDGHSGYWMFDVDQLSDEYEPVQMFKGDRKDTGAFILDGKIIGGGASCVAFQGEGADTKLYTVEEDMEWLAPNDDMVLCRYDLGESDYIMAAPAWNFDMKYDQTHYFWNTNCDVITTEDGLFVTQIRYAGSNDKTAPGFLYLDNQGNILLNSADIEGLESSNSGLAVSPDKKLVAVGTQDAISIYAAEWNEGVPTLTYKYDIDDSAAVWAQLNFDPAGNLHAFLRGIGYRVYSLTNDDPMAVTPAKTAEAIKVGQTKVIDIEAANEGEVVYYNLQGVRVPADNLTTGVYVKVQGQKAEKVLVK